MGIEGAASHLRDCEEKENDEKDSILKASRLQSPAKGCKNFMAPTISAASKFTPSPRKKVLVERNDPVRTSISLFDGKAMFFSAMPNVSESELGALDSNLADSEDKKAVHDSLPVSRSLKKVTFSDIPSYSQHLTESEPADSDVSKLESSSIAPLDADPLLPPYDPKTNYLSPRPQFIRYKPNARVGMLLNKEKWLDPDDSLLAEIMSQSFSDSDEGSDESHKEETEVAAAAASAASEDMVIGVDEEMEAAAASEGMVIGVDEEIDAESHVSESLPVSTTPAEEGFAQDNEKKPRRSLSRIRLMCSSMIMLLLIAAACVSFSPSFDEFVIKDLSLSDLSNAYQQSRVAVAASARLSFGRLARHVNHISACSVSLVYKLANELGKGEKRGPLQFMNLSDLQENPWNEGHFPHIVASLEPVTLEEDDEWEEEVDMDTEMDEAFEEDEYADEELDLNTDLLDAFEEEEEEAFAYAEADADADADETTSPTCLDLAELEPVYPQDLQSETDSDDQPAAASEIQETELEAAIEVALGQLETELLSQASTTSSDQTSFETTMPESTPAEESFLARHAVFLLAGLVAAAFIYQHKRNHPTSSNVARVEPVSRKQTDHGLASSKYVHKGKDFSQNWQTENDAIDGGESYCPSEMSGSFQKSASYSRREANEVQSSERKGRKYYTKRESLASSSGSPSYGSFTTYERIPIKSNANADEEIMTPVRRSSRIRNHHAAE